MTDKTKIGNRALLKLGQPRVSNFETDTTTAGITINGMWDNVRDALLQSYPWNFAIKRAILAPDGDDPEFGWGYQYTQSSDSLAILEVTDADAFPVDYTIEAGKILTNEGTALYVRYMSRITEVGMFSALFAEAFASRLAYEGCERITQNATKKELLLKEFDYLIQQAYTADAIETPPSELPEDTWIDARA